MSKDYAGKTLRGRPFPPGTDLRGASFKRATLRGVRFRGVDLTGADFIEADIRGADFTDATLCRANFTNARAGYRLRAVLAQSFAVLLSGLVMFLAIPLTAGGIANFLIQEDTISIFSLLVIAGCWLWCILMIFRHGLTAKAMIRIAFPVAATTAGYVAGHIVVGVVGADGVFGYAALEAFASAGGSVATAVATFSAVAITVAAIGAVGGGGGVAVAVAVAVVLVVAVASANRGVFAAAITGDGTLVGPLAIVVASAITITFVVHVARKVRREDERFAVARRFGLAVGALGGTRFRRANLADAHFDGALLARTDFRDATLVRVCWRNARRLDLARVESSILVVRAVRELMVTGRGASLNWTGCDLHGAYLEKAELSDANLMGCDLHSAYLEAANLSDANLLSCNLRGAYLKGADMTSAKLKQADLSEACLRGALLRNANLTECQAVGTDFTGATLTGATLQAWNIDHTTKLADVVCDYVFLLEHANERSSRERRPHDPDRVFEPGDFAKLYTKIIETIQILFRNGIDPVALREALIQLGREYPDIGPESIRTIERKDGDMLVTVAVPQDVDKAALERELRKIYGQLRQLEAENRYLLVAAERAQEAADRAHEVAMELARRPVQVNQVIGEGNDMSQYNDNRRSNQIGNIGGDFHTSGQAFSLGDHGSATATTNIGPAPAPLSQAQWQQDVKSLMTELTERMDALEDEFWRMTAAIFKKLHALDMDGKTAEQALATVEQTLDSNEKSTLRRALAEVFKSGRSILEDMAAAGLWSALFGG